jgi:hypothetical protein
MVSQLRDKNSELRRELRQWEKQHGWQAGTSAGANDQPLDPKSPAPCRLEIAGVDAEEGPARSSTTSRRSAVASVAGLACEHAPAGGRSLTLSIGDGCDYERREIEGGGSYLGL